MAGVAEAAADQDRAEDGLPQKAAGNIAGEFRWMKLVAVHFADFTKTRGINLLAKERRQLKHLVEIACSPEEVLIANEFVEAVGTESPHATEEERGRSELRAAKGGTAFSDQVERAAGGNRLEILQQLLQ